MKDTSGPAFPHKVSDFTKSGMTERRLIAKDALVGLLAGGANVYEIEGNAERAVRYADALLKELEK